MNIASNPAKMTLANQLTCSIDTRLLVLLVDDDPRYLMLCKRYLCGRNADKFSVHTAGTISEALSLCGLNNYDCLVIDYVLPDGTGTDLISTLSSGGFSNIPPAIITTSAGGEDAATEAIRAGAVDYLSKRNANSQSLQRTICNAVEKFQLSQSLAQRNIELLDANRSLLKNKNEIMQFYHTVSHEVKTPLAAAREFISLAQDGAEGELNDGQNQLMQLAIDSCDQIKKQFTELLEMTRLENGKLELERSDTPVDNLVRRSVTSVADLARIRKVRVYQVGDTNVEVLADPDRIVQVLSNLLHNAVKFSKEDSDVVLSTQLCDSGNQIEFCVTDSGCGIAEDERSSVFDRLFQSEHQRSQSSACGLGLGLAIAKHIVELHDSVLKLKSELNVGSSFYFRLALNSRNI